MGCYSVMDFTKSDPLQILACDGKMAAGVETQPAGRVTPHG